MCSDNGPYHGTARHNAETLAALKAMAEESPIAAFRVAAIRAVLAVKPDAKCFAPILATQKGVKSQ